MACYENTSIIVTWPGKCRKKCFSEQNMSEQTLVARRMIKDHICSVGGLTNVIVTQDLLNSAQGSRQKYMLHLELKRSESEKKEKGEKRKAVEMEAEVIRKKN